MTSLERLTPIGRGLRLGALLTGVVGAALLYRLRYGKRWCYTTHGTMRIRGWMRKVCLIVGLRIRVHGAPAGSPALLAVNHVSWLDIIALNATCPVHFVAKAEVRRWPWLGWLAALSGTLFLARGRGTAVERTLKGMALHLHSGRRVAVFPEGTTSTGDQVLPFHAALFDAAVRCRTPVQAVAIRYRSEHGPDRLAPFVGDDNLVSHLWRVLKRGQTEVEIHFLAPLRPGTTGRNRLAEQTRNAILAALQTVTDRAA